ncbi:hypothetical protein LSAT2_003327 [Lamellibrachia satsuma]|nr:hypothetical protein LSAT2_003327 [Lamellibrachia satsuma]
MITDKNVEKILKTTPGGKEKGVGETGGKTTGVKERGVGETGGKEKGVGETEGKGSGQNVMEGIERKSYSAAVIEGVRKRARVFVGDSIVRKTDRVLNKGDDVVVCLPGAKIEAITERVKNIVGSAFLDGRRQRVIINGSTSSCSPVTSGIPQGSVLGPILFVCYINDMPEVVDSPVHIFVDDTKILKALKLPSLYYRRARGDMIEVYKYLHGIYKVDKMPLQMDHSTVTRGHSLKLKKEQCPPNCDTCTQADGKNQCFSCFTGYVMAWDKNCNACPENCATCPADNRADCHSCLPSYAFDKDKVCKACSVLTFKGCNNCTNADSNGNNICLACMDDYSLKTDKSACAVCPENCTKCIYRDICDQCASGYELTKDREQCGVICNVCAGGAICETLQYDNSTVCPIGSDFSCWLEKLIMNDAATHQRYCRNVKCLSPFTVDHCEKHEERTECKRCCTSHKLLGPLLFLCHINDLPDTVKSTIRLFADDWLLSREVSSFQSHLTLQSDFKEWAALWGMHFNAQKCYVLSTKPRSHFYYRLGDTILKHVEQNSYILKWSAHIIGLGMKAG